jgi:hypothetical protein
MHLSKSKIVILIAILTLAATNIALAAFYMNRDVTVSGGVATSGTIEIYKEDGLTPMTAIPIPLFQGTTHTNSTFFWVKNIGNMPVAVYWNISSANPNSWTLESGGQAYIFTETSQTKYRLCIWNKQNPDGSQGTGTWNPDPEGAVVVNLNPGQTAQFAMDLLHFTEVNAPGTFSFVLSFYSRTP